VWCLVQKLPGHVKHKKDDMLVDRERNKRVSSEISTKAQTSTSSNVDSDDDDVTNDGKLFHARAADWIGLSRV